MERENSRPVLGRPAIFPAGPCPLSPKPGDGGASSFGLRLRTGERCSRRGRSRKGTEKLTGPSAPVHLRRTQNHPHGTPRGAPALTAMAALSLTQESRNPPFPFSCTQAQTEVSPSPAGAWSWSSCTDTARRPAERGLGLSWPSRGGRDIRACLHTLSTPALPLPPSVSPDESGPQPRSGVPTYLHS